MSTRHARTPCLAPRVALALLSLASNVVGAARRTASYSSPIKHVVVLMEENRSFDHMCGFFAGVDGLTGEETNPYNTSDPNSSTVRVGNTSAYVGPFNPAHGTPATTNKIFGMKGVAEGCKTPKMDGFIEYEFQHHKDPSSVMNMFTPDRLPILHTLASEFALFDRFFASHPGPTFPNRLFHLMGTSKGCTETGTGFLTKGRTIFDVVEEAGLDWRFYYKDAPLEVVLLRKLLESPLKVKPWKRFKKDAATGNLPAYSWLNPRWFVNLTTFEGASDQHPDHDVRLGEALIKEVYETLRASPSWNETLLIVTYDEHGGFYDHVPTPTGVPQPDASESFPDKGFNFTRLGVRIPTLLISPWVSKGKVINRPSPGSTRPSPNSEFDLTSVIATVKQLFNAPEFLTDRDAWAGTFEDHLSEPEPRTDCPETLPASPKSLGKEHAQREGTQDLNDLQRDIVEAFLTVSGEDPSKAPKLQSEGSEWIARVTEKLLSAGSAIVDGK